MLNKNILLQIKKLAIAIDYDAAFVGKSKGNQHLERIVKIAKFLTKKTGAHLLVVEAGAWLHDTALPTGNDHNILQNKKIVKHLLKPLGLSDGDLQAIAECVGTHEGTTKPKTLEAQVVHDADILEKTGILGIIRHTWKMTNLKKLNSKRVDKKDIKKILSHIAWRGKKLKTPIAKKIQKRLNIEVSHKIAKTIVAIASDLAVKGVVTERIAISIQRHLTQKQKNILREQLTLNFLRKFK